MHSAVRRLPSARNAIVGASVLLLVLIPVGLLAINALTWLRWGFDLPWADDWRALLAGNAGSFDLRYLFTPENQTLYPVGKFLNSLSQRLIGGNSVLYQFISMVIVLGFLLALQWALLRRVLVDVRLVAVAFVLCALSLATGTYWGGANLGYQQAVPVLCVLGVLYLAVSGRLGRLAWVIAVGLGLVAGFIYISGAFAVLGAGIVMTGVGLLLTPTARRRAVSCGICLIAAGLASSAAQTWLVLIPMKSGAAAMTTLPWSLDYWAVIMGIVADSLLLPVQLPLPSLVVALLATSIALASCIILVVRLWKRRSGRREGWLALCLITMVGTIGAYLMVVAAGRTQYLLALPGAGGAFEAGFGRFYEWWVTALWPWVAAAVLFGLVRTVRSRQARATVSGPVLVASAIAVLVAVFLIGTLRPGTYDYELHYRAGMTAREAIQGCLVNALQRLDGSLCRAGQLEVDLVPAVLYGSSIDASFTRYLPVLPGLLTGDMLFRWDGTASDAVQLLGITEVVDGPDGFTVVSRHPTLVLLLDQTQMGNCQILQLSADIKAASPEWSGVRFRRLSKTRSPDPIVAQQQLVPAGDDQWQHVSFGMASPAGFHPVLRFDPVSQGGTFGLRDLMVQCRRQRVA